MNDGVAMDVITGDPNVEGSAFVVRCRTGRAIEVPAHRHPGVEQVVVLAGIFRLGFGERFDRAALKEYAARATVTVRAGERHFAAYENGTEIEVRGVGPFRTIEVAV